MSVSAALPVASTAGLTGPALFFTLVLIVVVVLCAVGFFISIARGSTLRQDAEERSVRPVADLAAHRRARTGAETGHPADRWAE